MGLLKFLKEKFSKKNKPEVEEETEIESSFELSSTPIEEDFPIEKEVSPVEEAHVEAAPIEEKPAKEEPKEQPKEVKVEPKKEVKEEPKKVEIEVKPQKVEESKETKPVEILKEEPEKVFKEEPKIEEKPFEIKEEKSLEVKTEKPVEKKKEKPVEKKKDKKSKEKDDQEESLKIYEKGLEKSRKNFASKLDSLSKKYEKVNQEYFEELEQILIEADVGIALSIELIENLLNYSIENKISDPKDINEELIDEMFVDYVTKGQSIVNDIHFVEEGPTVLMVSGVNGVGKTTTIAKIAYRYLNKGKKVALVACDTFRAGAVAQLKIWAERIGCPIISGKENCDPASVAFEGARFAKNNDIDLLIVDTAGRIQTKQNLMMELGKISRVIGKEIPNAPHESFLIIDATTGQNGVIQAKSFKDVIPLTGIVITKMDGTSKGGIILSIRSELGIPVRFIGLGERMQDLQEFDLEKYLFGLLLGEESE